MFNDGDPKFNTNAFRFLIRQKDNALKRQQSSHFLETYSKYYLTIAIVFVITFHF